MGASMNCSDFDGLWNESLDARSPGLPAEAEAHAAGCASCRRLDARYQALRRNLGSWPAVPPATAESLRRLHALRVPLRSRPRPSLRKWSARGLALAASACAVAWLGLPGSSPAPGPPRVDRPPVVAKAPLAPARPLGVALAEARQVSIELAREATEQAARLRRGAFDLNGRRAPVAPTPDLDEDVAPPRPLLQAVGDRLNERVGPLPGSARHAFSFLLGPTPAPPTPPSQDSL